MRGLSFLLRSSFVALLVFGIQAFAWGSSAIAVDCRAFSYTDLAKTELPLTQTVQGSETSFEHWDATRMLYVSADYREGEDWVRLSIQLGNSGSAADAALRQLPNRGGSVAELLYSVYAPKEQFRIECSQSI